MKFLILVTLFLSSGLWAAEVKDFNKALLQDVKKESSDTTNEHYRKKEIMRGPASVGGPEVEPRTNENGKIEKIKQIGPSKW